MTAPIAQPLSLGRPDVETLLELSRLTDPVAVLSVYVDARPGTRRTASIDIKNRITELERRIAGDGSQERSSAIREGIARLEAEMDRLTDPEEPGRGRILFAAMTDSWLRCVSTQLPVPNRVGRLAGLDPTGPERSCSERPRAAAPAPCACSRTLPISWFSSSA
jgi:hypothetical protein